MKQEIKEEKSLYQVLDEVKTKYKDTKHYIITVSTDENTMIGCVYPEINTVLSFIVRTNELINQMLRSNKEYFK